MMALKLNLKKSVFPIKIGDFKFEVDLSNDKTTKLEVNILKFLKGIKELPETPENEEKFAALLETVYDELLGGGSYEKLYNHAKQVELLATLFEELVITILSKLSENQDLSTAIQEMNQTMESSDHV